MLSACFRSRISLLCMKSCHSLFQVVVDNVWQYVHIGAAVFLFYEDNLLGLYSLLGFASLCGYFGCRILDWVFVGIVGSRDKPTYSIFYYSWPYIFLAMCWQPWHVSFWCELVQAGSWPHLREEWFRRWARNCGESRSQHQPSFRWSPHCSALSLLNLPDHVPIMLWKHCLIVFVDDLALKRARTGTLCVWSRFAVEPMSRV